MAKASASAQLFCLVLGILLLAAAGGCFTAISNPFTVANGTRCVKCDDAFALSEFAWADTGERITDMLERHRKRTPGWAQALMSDSGCLASVVAGVLVGVGLA